ncbi:cell division protein FtsQ/DivIB [Pseudonocardia sp. HH130630-07]|uniref:cell division protein FtsQ/DivIB n=1 Tax=Pseudonocardia sp. HH130630-07 TaxID=1690815 RepID=UPI000814BE4D|nr:FtsQ-type POTRA domain-containing protein [Pseudonocardia sp. HH130630-07]ANY05087.1 hypothetical protein AFB00_00705 [Pseudonocardia sp. HH130630-07]
MTDSEHRDGGDDTGPGTGDDPGTESRRTPEQEQRAAERARRIRERRAAERSGGARRSPAAVRDRPAVRAAQRARAARAPHRRRRVVAVLAVAAVVLLGLSAAGWWALGRYGPGVAAVEVTGARQISDRDVADAAGVDPGTPLAAVDTDAVVARVSALPGVATVDVDRSWPDTLVVAVTERTPAALADTPDGRMLVDVSGFPYRPAPPEVRLPVLTLPTVAPDDPATLAAVGVLRALPPPVRDQVESLGPGAGGSTFELVLTEGRRVLWGPWGDPATTARRAAVLGPLLGREGAVYDVSSPDLVTVRPG